MKEFQWKGITWVVEQRSTRYVYRDKAHLGGPWSDVAKTLGNISVDATFRRLLKKATL